MTLPFEWPETVLGAEDLEFLAPAFSQTVLDLVPCAEGPVSFVPAGVAAKKVPAGHRPGIAQVQQGLRPVVYADQKTIFLPVWNGVDLVFIAVLEGLNKEFSGGLSGEWLLDRSRLISREFALLRQLAIDPGTGLLNGRHLREQLGGLLAERKTGFSLLLLEIHPRVRDAEKALHYIEKAGYYLRSCFGRSFLHHLGGGIFGLLLPGLQEEQAQKLGKKVLEWLKREKVQRVHLGITIKEFKPHPEEPQAGEEISADGLLAQAWQALRVAGRRGPFALCTHGSISSPENHPLCRPSISIINRLRRNWRGIDRFALLLMAQDQEAVQGFSKKVYSLIGPDVPVELLNKKEAYLFLPGAAEKEALAWIKDFKKRLQGVVETSFSFGVALFPFHGFKKSETLLNARKALLHTRFFGPDTVTVFDGVSLNVSGDIYYGEGDLVRAVQEYRRGIELDPGNINLLNSLGEANAQMNRHRAAISLFVEALRIEPENYMVLFNLGVAYLMSGNDGQAVDCFEKAMGLGGDGSSSLDFELYLQLGRLYCRAGKYRQAADLLEKCLADDEPVNGKGITRRSAGQGTVGRFLGEAYKGLGQYQKAIVCLQRATRHNPRDAASLSLLGELYSQENQGDDIALALCRQAVDLDETRWEHWLRLGMVALQGNDLSAASVALRESLRRNRKGGTATFMLGRVYAGLGQRQRAATMYKKALSLDPTLEQARAALKEC